MLKADGFDEAVIGVCRCKGREDVLAYSYEKCVDILMKRDKMSYEEAAEYMDFNVVDAYVGELTPAFVTKEMDFEVAEDLNFDMESDHVV